MRQAISQGAAKNFNLRVAAVVTAGILGLLAALFLGGTLTLRNFGIAGLVVMAVSGAAWYFTLKSSPRRNQEAKMSVKGFYIRVAVILALLVFSAWATRGGPWLPRLIGASVLVLFLIGTLRARR